MTNTSALAEKNRRIEELRAEVERLWKAGANTARERDEALARAEAAEARVKELEARYNASQESQRELLVQLARADRLAEALERMNEARAADADNVTEWVAGYQAAEVAIREALAAYRSDSPPPSTEALVALVEPAVEGAIDEADQEIDALNRAVDSPPQGEAVHPDTERLDWLLDGWGAGSTVLVKMNDGRWAVCFGNEPDHDRANADGRKAIDAAREAEGEE